MRKTNKTWRPEIWKWYDENRKIPFSREKNDCVRQTNTLLGIITGENFFPKKFLGYRTDKQALTILKKFNGMEKALDKFCKQHGLLSIDVQNRTTGDLVFFDSPPFGGVALVIGGTCVSPTENGLQVVPRQSEFKAWRILDGY
jgi:hypothetical protein